MCIYRLINLLRIEKFAIMHMHNYMYIHIYKYMYYYSKPLRLLYSLIIYEIVNFSFFALYSLLLLSFFLYLKSVPIYVIVHVCRFYCT